MMAEVEESKKKASILVEALPYVRRFRGSIFVIKYGGSFMDSPDPETRAGVARDLVFLNFVGIKVVVTILTFRIESSEPSAAALRI